jgi:uncharacterized Ntn-hydrolase superfamily protein
MLKLATFSIAARCPQTGMFGVAVSTKVPAVGSICPFAKPGVGAIASQAWANPYIGIYGLRLLAELVRDTLVNWDPDIQKRQFTVVDKTGASAAFTGDQTDAWQGHRTGDGYAAAGNMLVGAETVDAMAEAFEKNDGVEFHERLLMALEAGQAAGGDKRGKQSAALYVVHQEEFPYADLRVDEHADPVAELRRVFEVCRTEYFPFMTTLPTRDNPMGSFDTDILERMRPKD